ncbi:CoA pyrophosphatase [Pigmentiphaga soli]|uniref:CoA pyrophosphatase n=1 Tax=Pigmentiphaga soli TaxID=1007095 RepID=A0ABP8GYD8_9BURK
MSSNSSSLSDPAPGELPHGSPQDPFEGAGGSPPRRVPVRPAFDPKAQPFVVNPDGLPAVPEERLAPRALRERLRHPPAWAPEPRELAWRDGDTPPRPASVLVPLVLRPAGVHVMLTQRTAHLNHHAGQVSFPGGRVEATDASEADTALRETEEETGLSRDLVEMIGRLPDYLTSSGFRIAPMIGLVRPAFSLAPDPFEVAAVFEVPLRFLMDPANHRVHSVALPHNGQRVYYSMPWNDYFIWGATAGMLRDLYRLLSA